MFEHVPYTNFHELNTDWIIKVVKEFEDHYTGINEALDAAIAEINEKGTEAATNIEELATAKLILLNEWYNQHSSDISSELAAALAEIASLVESKTTEFEIAADERIQNAFSEIPEDYAAMATAISALTTTGKNLYNYATATNNLAYRYNDHNFASTTGAFTSDYIPVLPNTYYTMNKSLESTTTFSYVVYFNSAKTVIGEAHGNEPEAVKTFQTPANTAYVRICGFSADMNSTQLEKGQTVTEYVPFMAVLNGRGVTQGILWADGPIIYTGGYIKNLTGQHLYVYLGNNTGFTLGNNINVGTNALLFFNSSTQTLHTSNTFIASDVEYFLGFINYYAFNSNERNEHVFITSATPVLTFDLVNNKAYVDTTNGAYCFYKEKYFSLTSETATLNLTSHSVIYIDLNTKKLVTGDYDYVTNKSCIAIAVRNGSTIECVIPYNSITNDNNCQGKSALTYGDSLVWYDGQNFTWGSHQGEKCIGFQSYMRADLGMTVNNSGESGNTTPEIENKISAAYAAISAADYCLVMPSFDNDHRLSVDPGEVDDIGSTFDDTTTAGALQKAIEHILNVNPSIRLVIMTEPQGFLYSGGAMIPVPNDYYNVTMEIAELYHLPVIDLWQKAGVNALNKEALYADPADNTQYFYHPYNPLWKRLSKLICDQLKEL